MDIVNPMFKLFSSTSQFSNKTKWRKGVRVPCKARGSREFLIPLCLRILPFLLFTSPSGIQTHGSGTRMFVRVCVWVCALVSGRVVVSLIDKVSWQRQQFLVNTGAGLAPQINDIASLKANCLRTKSSDPET